MTGRAMSSCGRLNHWESAQSAAGKDRYNKGTGAIYTPVRVVKRTDEAVGEVAGGEARGDVLTGAGHRESIDVVKVLFDRRTLGHSIGLPVATSRTPWASRRTTLPCRAARRTAPGTSPSLMTLRTAAWACWS